jgi:Kef-type K+ transport system membrane component KefB
VAVSFCVLLVSSYIADVIGIHVLFGAFLAGVVMPPNEKFKELLTYKLEDVSSLILLPIFFAITGLRTQIGLLTEPAQWLLCLAIIGVAVLGKFGGATAAAKLVGQPWRSSFSIGALMNTRGLMELVVLNIGYDMGILSAELFAIMVLMALATTFMTSPLLDLINMKHAHNSKI